MKQPILRIAQPELPETLPLLADPLEQLRQAQTTEKPLRHCHIQNLDCNKTDFSGLECNAMRFDHCIFEQCRWQKASFQDVLFDHCDFSNCDLQETFFLRCRFQHCKGLGADFSEACLQQVTVSDSQWRYVNLCQATLRYVQFLQSDLTESNLMECQWRHWLLQECNLTGASFFHTSLKGMDLTSCQIAQLQVSKEAQELRGAIISYWQAPELIRLLGIILKE